MGGAEGEKPGPDAPKGSSPLRSGGSGAPGGLRVGGSTPSEGGGIDGASSLACLPGVDCESFPVKVCGWNGSSEPADPLAGPLLSTMLFSPRISTWPGAGGAASAPAWVPVPPEPLWGQEGSIPPQPSR